MPVAQNTPNYPRVFCLTFVLGTSTISAIKSPRQHLSNRTFSVEPKAEEIN